MMNNFHFWANYLFKQYVIDSRMFCVYIHDVCRAAVLVSMFVRSLSPLTQNGNSQ